MQRINGLLYFGGHELVILNSEFYIKKIGAKVEVQAPKIKTIDREYIKSISSRAMQDVDQSNYDSAITKARTLLEETFCYVVEKKGDTPSSSGNMSDLYKQVKGHYNMHADSNTDRRINTLLSGLEKIVSAISEMRNKDSDVYYYDTYKKYAETCGHSIWECKIGRTDKDPLQRIFGQAGTCYPELPHIALIMKCSNSFQLESALHNILKLRNRWIENAPGTEWFLTSPAEVESFYHMIVGE